MPSASHYIKSSRCAAARFLATFAVLAGVFYAAAASPPFVHLFYLYLEANAQITNAILAMMSQHTYVYGLTVHSPEFSISIRRGCDGLEPAWIFGSAVLAFPSRARGKALILLTGIALILVLNIVRIVSLYFIGSRLPAFFPTAHLELWPAAFMVLVISIWLYWLRALAKNGIRES